MVLIGQLAIGHQLLVGVEQPEIPSIGCMFMTLVLGAIPSIYTLPEVAFIGWYSRDKGYGVKCNNTVIYPDEAFIVARRSSGTVTLESEISFDDSPTQIYLPESGKTFIANNPFGMDLLLTEIIPSTEIHDSTTSKFRAGASDSDIDMDTITILASGTWKKYWYKSGVNSGITTTMEASGKAGSGGSSAMTTSDLFIGSGSISAIQSSSNAAGTSIVTNYNDGNYTKLTLTGTAPGTGFTITSK